MNTSKEGEKKKGIFFTLLGYRTEGPLMFGLSDIQKTGSILSLGRRCIPPCLGVRICSRTFAVVGVYVPRPSNTNLATLPVRKHKVQGFELEESDTKNMFTEVTEDSNT